MARTIDSVLIVGAGQGGYQVAASLRGHGYQGRLVLIDAEGELPYERPPLSKSYLHGETDEDGLRLRPTSYYARRSIELVAGWATAIDPAARTVRLVDGRSFRYDHLVLATGAGPRTLGVPGSGLRGVHTLRTVRDADALRSSLGAARHAVVVGAGFIGLEFAAAARRAGREVTVVEALDRPLARMVSARTAEYVTRLHRREGTRLLFGRGVAAVHGDDRGRVAEVELDDGDRLPADLLLTGIGVIPRTDLAAAAGLRVNGGIVVDAHLVTSDPHISAIGDCAAFPQVRSGNLRRLESVQNAVGHAETVAARLTGTPSAYTEPPWFWSDQFATTVHIAGLAEAPDTEVILGHDDPNAFSVLRFRAGELQAVESINRPTDHAAARQLLSAGTPVNPTDAGAPGFTLHAHLTRHHNNPPIPTA
ncbi:NAD(P)/FAD-dependent oxidoreductase [Embleya sp. NPDC020630]|uniref:NAD(P)/FAD-dependent oxidoreductase n=1 Tax=Embleya sp. NPDC020630 TaxID=3363979 RepID=UPI0037BDE7B2